jgi:branched-chain amino acid transport system substrate-binding protein
MRPGSGKEEEMAKCKPLAMLLLATLLVVGCGREPPPFECTDAIGCVDMAPGEPVKVGALQALTNDMGPQGAKELLQCTELALDDRGRELLGHSLELQTADSMCSGEGGTTAALKLSADPQVIGLIGPSCSGAAASAMKVVSDAGLVMIAGSCSAPSLTSVGGEPGADWEPGFLRTAQNDALVGHSAATFAFRALGVRRAATIHDGDAYSRGLTDSFDQAFSDLGGEVVLATAGNQGDTDLRPVLAAVAASGAELVFLPVFRMEGDYLVLQAKEVAGMETVKLMSAEGLYSDVFIEAVGAAGVGMYFTAPVRPEGPAYDAFVSRYEAKYGEPPRYAPYHAHVYDAANLLLSTIEAVAAQEEDGTLHIGRQALRDALYATTDYPGLTGNLACDEHGDCGVDRFNVLRLDDPAAGLRGLEANVVYAYPPEE